MECAVAETKEQEPEPSGRKRQEPKDMGSDEFVAAFGLATRLRAHEVDWQLDAMLQRWLGNAQEELKSRKELRAGARVPAGLLRPDQA
jgi:hypothetical protein